MENNNRVLIFYDSSVENASYYIEEFSLLLKALDLCVVFSISQNIKEVSTATYMGKGKIFEIKQVLQDFKEKGEEIAYVIVNFDLTAVMQKNLEDILEVPVIDRSTVILKIFEENAQTKEAKLQVEIAKLSYLKARLINNKAQYSQVTSGSKKNKGEGEKKLELTKRKINEAITQKEKELLAIKKARQTMRVERNESGLLKIAVVGYTNAGKSTLINRFLSDSLKTHEKDVYSKDALFATLQTATRKITSFKYPSFLLTDTVGFISHLPTHLIKAFRSTLEEIKEANLLIHVVDISSPFYLEEIKTTNEVIKQLNAENIPFVLLFNKCDKIKKIPLELLNKEHHFVSLTNDENIEDIYKFIFDKISENWEKYELLIPYSENFVEFKKDNYVISFYETDEGYMAKFSLNPLRKYKYVHLL